MVLFSTCISSRLAALRAGFRHSARAYSRALLVNSHPAPLTSTYDRILLYDGVCRFCNTWVDLMLRFDEASVYKLCALQSDTGVEHACVYAPLCDVGAMTRVSRQTDPSGDWP
jgi:hypothetical protein